jgi:hypothetical protein
MAAEPLWLHPPPPRRRLNINRKVRQPLAQSPDRCFVHRISPYPAFDLCFRNRLLARAFEVEWSPGNEFEEYVELEPQLALSQANSAGLGSITRDRRGASHSVLLPEI